MYLYIRIKILIFATVMKLLKWYLILNYEIWPEQFKLVINLPFLYIVWFKTRLQFKNRNKVMFVPKSRLDLTKTTLSPFGIETYYWIDGKLVCSILERNGQGWFIRRAGTWIGESCISKKQAKSKAIELCKIEQELSLEFLK